MCETRRAKYAVLLEILPDEGDPGEALAVIPAQGAHIRLSVT